MAIFLGSQAGEAPVLISGELGQNGTFVEATILLWIDLGKSIPNLHSWVQEN